MPIENSSNSPNEHIVKMESDENGVFDHSTGTPAENIEALDNMAEGKKFILSPHSQTLACIWQTLLCWYLFSSH